MNYDKPFKTYQEQVLHIEQKHGLRIEDKALAERFLRVYSYYDLVNGYSDILMVNDIFNSHISFNYLILFNDFNLQFQNALIKYSFIVENIFKSNLAYILSQEFGEDVKDYLNINNYINAYSSSDRRKLVKTIKRIQSIAATTDDFPTKHYRENHNHIPPWILFKNITFGITVELMKLLDTKEEQKLCDLMLSIFNPLKPNMQLSQALTIVRKFRNAIAHNLKFVSFKAPQSLVVDDMPNLIVDYLLDDRKGQQIDDIYAMIVSLVYLLNEPFLIEDFVKDLQALFKKFSDNNHYYIVSDYLQMTGIPDDLLSRLNTLFHVLKFGYNSHN